MTQNRVGKNDTAAGIAGEDGRYKVPHTFHIPVMGTGFTIDTPLRVARYGITSVVSIGDDMLIESMRKFHCEQNGLEYRKIGRFEEDARARRITAYLNLLELLTSRQVKSLQGSPFEPGSEITRYYEMLPDSPLKQLYREMQLSRDTGRRDELQRQLRKAAVPGRIDVNIMTKIDGDVYRGGKRLAPEYAIAMSALRGFALSRLRSSIVLSAGLNRRLFGYMANFADFLPDADGRIKKKIILKVSDFRSAVVQGKMLASRGLWVSEFRIESGLNCGGHAFATKGLLLGPILEEFREKKTEMVNELHRQYIKALGALGQPAPVYPRGIHITVQGGICTADEDRFLTEYYDVDGTGWGTPFLLVPEVTNVDEEHLKKLAAASADDVHLSQSSPLGVPFWNLRVSASEETRRRRIREGRPGSPCPKGYLESDTEFTERPLCRASRKYQELKLRHLEGNGTAPELKSAAREEIVSKSCICLDLAGGALLKNHIDDTAKTAVCSGPNIEYFSRIVGLDRMVDHIYGRLSLLAGIDRPHVFIKELNLYIEYLGKEIERNSAGLINLTAKYLGEFKENLNSGVEYYRQVAREFGREQRERFLHDLDELSREIERILPAGQVVIPAASGA